MGASTWKRVSVSSVSALYGVAVADGGLVLAAGAGGQLLRSVDRGQTFSPAGHAGSLVSSLWCSPDGSRVVATSQGVGVMRSTDGGLTFSQAKSRARYPRGLGGHGDEMLLVGQKGVAQRSSDGGQSFKPLRPGTPYDLFASGVDGEGGLYLLGSGQLLSSRDHGASFSTHRTLHVTDLRSVAVFPGGIAVAVGDLGMVLVTRDRGASWAERARTGMPSLYGIWGPSPERLWAVGSEAIYRSDDVGSSWQLEHEEPGVWLQAIAGSPGGPVVAVGGQLALVRETG